MRWRSLSTEVKQVLPAPFMKSAPITVFGRPFGHNGTGSRWKVPESSNRIWTEGLGLVVADLFSQAAGAVVVEGVHRMSHREEHSVNWCLNPVKSADVTVQ